MVYNGECHNQRTYWLMRMMATSSRSVNFLNASSIAWGGVSSFHFKSQQRFVRRRENGTKRKGGKERYRERERGFSVRTGINDEEVGATWWTVVTNSSEKESSGGVLIADDGNEIASFARFDAPFGIHDVGSVEGGLLQSVATELDEVKGNALTYRHLLSNLRCAAVMVGQITWKCVGVRSVQR